MYHTSEFIMRMAKDTPSAFAPKHLKKKVRSPHPTPNITLPHLVMGQVT